MMKEEPEFIADSIARIRETEERSQKLSSFNHNGENFALYVEWYRGFASGKAYGNAAEIFEQSQKRRLTNV